MAIPPRTRQRVGRRLAAVLAAIVVRAAVRGLPFRYVTRYVRRVLATTHTTASTAETETALDAVDTAARWLPFRVACLERSLSALLLLALRRKAATWCHGVRTTPLPLELHAWLTDESGKLIGEPNIDATYEILTRISR